jgi:hypothetical protein
MSPTKFRSALRCSHIAIGVMLGGYICSPLHLDPTATLIVRLALLPLIGLTGIAMWQQGRLTRLFKKSSRKAQRASAGK